MSAFVVANLFEAGLWCGMALVLLAMSRASWSICAVLVAFGLSDLVEARTGAWWDPWWLLLWKGGCVLYFVALGIRALHMRRHRPVSSFS